MRFLNYHKAIVSSFLIFIIVLGIYLLFARSQTEIDKPLSPSEPTTSEIINKDPLPSFLSLLTNSKDSEFDESYINSVITHTAIGTAMAQLVTDSKDEEIRTLAKYIIDKNKSTDDQFRSWANAWSINIVEPDINAINGIISNIKKYDDEERDHQFTLDILDHFDGSIGMAKLATTNAAHKELISFAGELVEDELEHASLFYQWSRTVSFDSDDRSTAMHITHDS